MPSLLHNLLVDLRRRAVWLLQELGGLQNTLRPNFEAHRLSIEKRVLRSVAVVDNLLADPDLGNPVVEPNFFKDFKRLSEWIVNVEDSSLLILKRCSEDDRYLSAILAQICREVGYQDAPPLCGALSFQYFQALVGSDIIMTPQTQASDLLSLPDLYHELAHFVLFRYRASFAQPLRSQIYQFFLEASRKAKQRGMPAASLTNIQDTYDLWMGPWHIEFACDMVATYWCGPSYGMANLRLSATRGDPYQDNHTHPADDARRTGIECLLKTAGDLQSATAIDQMWLELKRLSPSQQPQGYASRYPAQLLEKLAQIIHKSCVDAGFRSFADQLKQNDAHVLRTVSKAWDTLHKDVQAFSKSELAAIQNLKQQLSF
jgi:hypothetical protein